MIVVSFLVHCLLQWLTEQTIILTTSKYTIFVESNSLKSSNGLKSLPISEKLTLPVLLLSVKAKQRNVIKKNDSNDEGWQSEPSGSVAKFS